MPFTCYNQVCLGAPFTRTAARSADRRTTLLHADGSVAFAGVLVRTLLWTRALLGAATARLCEHFEGNGTCNRGAKCRFVHRAAATAAAAPTARRSAALLTASASSDATGPARSSGSESSGGRRMGAEVATSTSVARFPSAQGASTGMGVFNGAHHPQPPAAAAAAPMLRALGRSGPRRRAVVQTSRGWRHAAYDAGPHRGLAPALQHY